MHPMEAQSGVYSNIFNECRRDFLESPKWFVVGGFGDPEGECS